jgi:AcrR family transcriptional regulator
MPPKPRTKAQQAERRQLILDQTRALARDAGWDAVTMRAVAERARLSGPSVYELFPGKAALLAAVAREGFAELAQSLASTDGDADL